MKKITVIKIDPEKRHICRITVDRRPDMMRKHLGIDAMFEVVAEKDGNPVVLVVQNKDRVTEGAKFRVKGHSKHAIGTALIVGLHAKRAVSAPVDMAWANRMIEWIDE